MDMEIATFGAGCFWGVEYFIKSLAGVESTTVGYCGGDKTDPTYEEVSDHGTGHAETVEVEYDPETVTYETLAKAFFSLHDFTQVDRQGPDIGTQYRSEIFYVNEEQKEVAEDLIAQLEERDYEVATKVTKFEKFWPAEEYHQDYYDKQGGVPYCHSFKEIW